MIKSDDFVAICFVVHSLKTFTISIIISNNDSDINDNNNFINGNNNNDDKVVILDGMILC